MRNTLYPGNRGVSPALAVELTVALALLAGCGSTLPPRPGPPAPSALPNPSTDLRAPALPAPSSSPDRDGPEANPPPDLVRVPDAEPRLDPIRQGGPNKPYAVFGQSYVPITFDAPFRQRGGASWYGRKFQGKPTASGELYNMYAMTAAHPTLPIPSYARVRNPANGREVLVRINDRGPFHSTRIVDLSYTAALKLGVLHGVSTVELERITLDDIRTGAWRREGALPPVTAPVATDGPMAVAAVPMTVVNALPPVPPERPPELAPESPPESPPESLPESRPAIQPPPTEPAQGVATAPIARAFTLPARGFWVQLGAFRQRIGAEDFQKRVEAELHELGPLLGLFGDTGLFRLQAGPYPSREEARSVAERLRAALQLVPVIVERR
ncbi:MAG: septal ring lytic transglycosylase RlpA family protein [Bacteriovorax sp.]|nr:septal ring lytic transglycosylase RlpA family protein [Rhizobacter sp.]